MKFSSEENLGKYLTEISKLKPQEIALKNHGVRFKSLNQKISELQIKQVAITKSITTNGYSASTPATEIKEEFSRLPFIPSPLFASILNEKGEFGVGSRLVRVTN